MNHLPKTLALLACLLTAPSFAQTPQDLAAARARYKQEVADCAATKSGVDHRSCVQEARNTLAEIKRGRMRESWASSDFEKNALLRCDVHLVDDKLDCMARMRGQGKTEGSVAGGGLLRELTTTTIVSAPPALPRAEPKRIPLENLPSGLMSNCRWVAPADWVCK